jgi:hypothetical protein
MTKPLFPNQNNDTLKLFCNLFINQIQLDRSVYFLLLFLFSMSKLVGQTTWTGNINNNWSIAGNWTNGVPDATDIVTIPNVFPNPDPIIMNGTVALGRSVTIESTVTLVIEEMGSLTLINSDFIPGILNQGLLASAGTIIISTNHYGINNQGSIQIQKDAQLTITGAGLSGIQTSVNSFFSNHGNIDIGTVSGVTQFGIASSGGFTNQSEGRIRLSRYGQHALVVGPFSTFNNFGMIETGIFESFGTIGVINLGELFNHASGTIRIDHASSWAIQNETSGIFNNSGIINLGNNTIIGNGIENGGIFNHTSGEITINRLQFRGIFNLNEAEFYSGGIIRIGNESSNGNFGIENRGYFEQTLGEIHIDRYTLWGIYNHFLGEFKSKRFIFIGSLGSAGTNGIRNEGPFTNDGGTITINNTSQTALLNNSASFQNLNGGFLIIGNLASVGEHGIRQENSASFINQGPISIDRFSDAGLRNNSLLFDNYSTFHIGQNAISSGWSIYNPTGNVINRPGGGMVLFGPLSLGENNFSNLGYMSIISTEPHENSGFTNHGIIGYTNENQIPNVTNENVIALPLIGECGDIINALQFGDSPAFEILDSWLGVEGFIGHIPFPAGTYDLMSNVFSPTNIPDGLGLLMVPFTDPNINFTGFVFTTIALEDVTPPTVTCFDIEVVFNGEEEIQLDPISLADALDNCGMLELSLSTSIAECKMIGQIIEVTVTASDGNQTSQCVSQITVSGLPCGWSQDPDGINCNLGNEVQYDPVTEQFDVTSTNCYYGNPFNDDAMAFAQRTLCGDGTLTAEVISITGGLGWAGLIMRENNEPGAKKIQLTTNRGSFVRRELRTVTNGSAHPQQFLSPNRFWLRLVRKGNQFSGFTSHNGITWNFVMAGNISMGQCIQMGMIVTNYNSNSTVAGTFANVSYEEANMQNLPISADLLTVPEVHNFEVYPNPASTEVWVNLKSTFMESSILEVTDMQGKVVFTKSIQTMDHKSHPIQIQHYTPGVYVVRLKSQGQPDSVKKLVVAPR